MYRECVFLLMILTINSRSKPLESSEICNKIIKNERYVFKGPSCPTFFNVKFIEFDLRPFAGCKGSSLEVVGNEVLCGRIHGTRTYFSSEGMLRMKIVLKGNFSDDSYKILVTRMPCFVKPRDDTNVSRIAFKSERHPSCCAGRYDAKQFYMTSPNFPYSNNVQDRCVYDIYKFSPHVCRLQIHFLYFSLDGQTGNTCHKSFLQLDDNYFCGCRTGLHLVMPFNSSTKTITFKNGQCRGEFTGFVIEVTQEECPSFSDEPALYISEPNLKMARLTQEDIYSDKSEPDVVKHVYVFEDTGDNERSDKEDVVFVPNDVYQCKPFDITRLKVLTKSKDILWQQISQCSTFSSNSFRSQCVQANLIKGYIQSPEYPYFYPKGLNTCYRFESLRGYCAVRLYILDFDVDNSFHCEKDYFLLSGQYKYCGRTLHKASLTFDLRNRDEEIAFITNGFSCRRGFRGVYERIPCNNDGIPVDPVHPSKPTTLTPITSTPTIMPHKPCDRNIRDNVFLLEVYGYHQSRCIFNIIRNDERVCSLLLKFEQFSLSCKFEYLLIGNTRYCGNRNGESVTIEFADTKLPITYVRSSTLPVKSSLRFRISGRQMITDCDLIDVPTVEPERLVAGKTPIQKDAPSKDICGLLLNSKEDLASKICKIIKTQIPSSKCIPITEKMSFMMHPTSKDALGVVFGNRIMRESITAHEVACKDIYTVIFT
ncbi:hypothetical protein PPYR_09716 [Photinus pyralis]|uniref:CUB domain-containing protein n=1 Tax=Photinus pyralis TaxID=7054 RepID=A0A5N4AN74_PHOPY|nr:hypothetical protein PPYR_09716 [Photinus pyralis]